MTRFLTIQRSNWTIFYAVIAVLAIIVLLVNAYYLAASLLFLVAATTFALLYRIEQHASTHARSQFVRPRPYIPNANEPVVLEDLVTADGQVLAARVVPVANMTSDRLLLTAAGYVVVDKTGREVYRFGPSA